MTVFNNKILFFQTIVSDQFSIRTQDILLNAVFQNPAAVHKLILRIKTNLVWSVLKFETRS